MTLRYFGTDGIRGKALSPPLTLQEATRWGAAWSQVGRLRGIEQLLIGWDPRLSSEPLYHAFRTGVGQGLDVVCLGMVPTPAVAWSVAEATRNGVPTWGLMISASHNPPEDNGLKGFDQHGEKLSEATERGLEDTFEALQEPTTILVDTPQAGIQPYLDHLGTLEFPADFKIVMDCAHGATAPWAEQIFSGQGLTWLGTPEDGARINVGVGSTHLEALRAEVLARSADLGVAFDGDGDRCLFLDAQGNLVDGDQMLWLLALERRRLGEPLPGVVGTLMTNGGLEAALRSQGIPFVRTPVGDKFLLREMSERGWDLAAEASGHVIQKNLGPSGDGLATALTVLKALLTRPAAERWSWRFHAWPLRLVNLVARERRPLEQCAHLRGAMASLESSHGDDLRLVVRWSGTEPKLRLMGEAMEPRLLDEALDQLEAAAKVDLGI
jgi:phosphoglucosamine mutase